MSVHTKKHLIDMHVKVMEHYKSIVEKFIASLDGIVIDNVEEDTVNWEGTQIYNEFKDQSPSIALKVHRENANLSQTELAEKMGNTVKQHHISEMERGLRGISIKTAHQLAKILNVGYRVFL